MDKSVGWERLASHEGGTIVGLAAALVSGNSTPLLLAATPTGLFRSEDGGRTWSSNSQTPLPLLNAVAASSHSATNAVYYAGTQTGFFRSADYGRTWRQTLSGGRVFAIAVAPSRESEEHVFIGTQDDGILRSDDTGQTWTGANAGLLDLTVLALAFSPDATRDQTGFAATASGLYRTRNGGKSWRAVELPLDEPAVQALAISPAFADDRLIFAGTEHDGLWRSDDGGATWAHVPGLPDGGIGAIAFSTQTAESRLVAAATEDGVALSRDGGATWSLHGEPLHNVLSLLFIADGDGETLVAGLYRDGIARFVLTDHDAGWIQANTGLGATFLTTLIASPTFLRDQTIVAAGPDAGIRVSRDGGARWGDVSADLGGAEVHDIAITADADEHCVIFAATSAGIYRSRNNGERWEAPTAGGDLSVSIVVTGAGTEPTPPPLFAATLDGNLIASEDGGETWRSINAPFDGATIISLACSPTYTHDRTLYVGTTRPTRAGNGSVRAEVSLWRSTDGGKRWARWLTAQNGSRTLPLAVSTDHASSNRHDAPFVGLAGKVWHPRRNAWQTRNGVRYPLWRDASLTTREGDSVAITALAVSPHFSIDRTIVAATSAGVYRSLDAGRTFAAWNNTIEPVPMLALSVTSAPNDEPDHPTFLVFALDVRGTIWRRASNA